MMLCLNTVLCNRTSATSGNDLFLFAGSDDLTKILQLVSKTCCGIPVTPHKLFFMIRNVSTAKSSKGLVCAVYRHPSKLPQ